MRKGRVAIAVSVVVIIGLGIYFLMHKGETKAGSASNLTYQVNEVTKDEVTSSVSASGTLTPVTTTTITSEYSGTIQSVTKKTGDSIKKGDTILTFQSEDLEKEIANTQSQLDTLVSRMASMSQVSSSKYVKASVKGIVKDIQVEDGNILEEVMQEKGYLFAIAIDGKMKVVIPVKDSMHLYDEVTLRVGDSTAEGMITKIADGKASIVIETTKYDVGAEANVYGDEDALLGTGTLELNEHVKVKASKGVIAEVLKAENSSVSASANILQLADYPEAASYTEAKEEKEQLEEKLETLMAMRTVKAQYDGRLTDLKVASGSLVAVGDTLAIMQGNDGYELVVTVDELDISDVSVGLACKVEIEALNGIYDGTVDYISNVGDTNGTVTNYEVKIKVEEIEGVLSGMSASATITTSLSGETLVVPVNAVQTERGESYVYLAPTSVDKGEELEESEVDTKALEKVTVTTGMSDGSYMEIKGDIKEGTLILVPVLTATQDGSSSDDSMKGFQNMQGGGMMGSDMQGGTMPGGSMPNFDGSSKPNRGSDSETNSGSKSN